MGLDANPNRAHLTLMTLLAICLLVSLALWTAAAIPGSRVPEWSGRAGFFVTALVWVLT